MLDRSDDQRRIAEKGAEVIRQTGVLDQVADIVERQAEPYRRPHEATDPTLPMASRIIKAANAFDDMVGESARVASRDSTHWSGSASVWPTTTTPGSSRPSPGSSRRTGGPRSRAMSLSSLGWFRPVADEVRAEMVANVWKVVVAAGDAVADGDTLVILESMKMEIPVLAEQAAP